MRETDRFARPITRRIPTVVTMPRVSAAGRLAQAGSTRHQALAPLPVLDTATAGQRAARKELISIFLRFRYSSLELAPALEATVRANLRSIAVPTTWAGYWSRWRRFSQFCKELKVPPLPATENIVCLFFAALPQGAPEEADRLRAAINFVHRHCGISPVSGEKGLGTVAKLGAANRTASATLVARHRGLLLQPRTKRPKRRASPLRPDEVLHIYKHLEGLWPSLPGLWLVGARTLLMFESGARPKDCVYFDLERTAHSSVTFALPGMAVTASLFYAYFQRTKTSTTLARKSTRRGVLAVSATEVWIPIRPRPATPQFCPWQLLLRLRRRFPHLRRLLGSFASSARPKCRTMARFVGTITQASAATPVKAAKQQTDLSALLTLIGFPPYRVSALTPRSARRGRAQCAAATGSVAGDVIVAALLLGHSSTSATPSYLAATPEELLSESSAGLAAVTAGTSVRELIPSPPLARIVSHLTASALPKIRSLPLHAQFLLSMSTLDVAVGRLC